MQEKRFDRLLKKYLLGKLPEQKSDSIDKWLDSIDHTKRDHAPWSEDDRSNLFDRINAEIEVQENSGRTTILPVRVSAILKYAAAVLVLTISSYFALYWYQQKSMVTYSTERGEIKKIILIDGSIVWLKENSKLRYAGTFSANDRRVVLDGDGLFEVAKDASHPFAITCGELVVNVLGTSFDIAMHEDTTEVLVLTGKVRLSHKVNLRREVIIYPKEKGIFSLQDHQLRSVAASQHEIDLDIQYTNYDMRVDNLEVQEVIKRIEDKFNVRVNVENENLNTCKISADFTDLSLDKTFQLLTEVFHSEYIIAGNTIRLTGGRCR